MSEIDEKRAYKGIPIALVLDEDADWPNFAPIAGPIQPHTLVYNPYERGFTSETCLDDDKTLSSLIELARQEKFYNKLVANAQGLFDEVVGLNPHCRKLGNFNPKNPGKLTPAEREEFVESLLEPGEGFRWLVNEHTDGMFDYVTLICGHGDIPHYSEEVTYMLKAAEHRIAGFSADGSELSKADREKIKKDLEGFFCYVNGSIFNIVAPTHMIYGLAENKGLTMGDADNSAPIKEIEASVDKLLAKRSGDYEVTVPYAREVDDPARSDLIFDPNEKITLYAKTAKEASRLAVYWDKFGQEIDVKRVRENE